MPSITIDIFEGRTKDQKSRLVKEMTDAVVNVLGVKPETVHIIIYENARENVSSGGRLLSEKT